MNQVGIDSTAFRDALLEWYGRGGRKLPWRATMDPYAILVSEFMLQQTQVVTAIPYYHRWLERFPTVRALAAASSQEMLAVWQGLGLYRRAQNLQRCAQAVVEAHGGVFPRSMEALRALPGVGRYTAGAVASFAFNLPAPVVDGNVARVLSRVLNLTEPIDSSTGRVILWDVAERLAQCDKPRLVNNALMELGALICKPRNPACVLCPVRTACRAVDPKTLPRKQSRPAMEARVERYWWIYDGRRVLLQQRPPVKRWAGLWTLPVLIGEEPKPSFVSLRHHVTRYSISLQVVQGSGTGLPDLPPLRWQPLAELAEIPIPTPHRRAIALAVEAEGWRSAPPMISP